MTKKTVLITGGAGFIGSHVNQKLHEANYQTIVLDNLCRGFREAVLNGIFIHGDLQDAALLHQIFSTYKIDAVMHFAAYIDVGESVQDPLKYYQNNVAGTLQLLQAMCRHQTKVSIFSSSAAVYGVPDKPSISESHPCQPINPYGRTKLYIEEILKDLSHSNAIKFTALRYFNAAGGDPQSKIKNFRQKEHNLIPKVLRCIQKNQPIKIYGTDYPTPDGTCIRDYIHVNDLASAHIKAMEKLMQGESSNVYNLGNGKGFSVKEVIETAFKVTGKEIAIIEDKRREGDPPILIADSSKAKQELEWEPKHPSLKEIIADAWTSMS